MAKLSETRYNLVHHILSCIARCEGGSIETILSDKGDIVVQLTPDIPPQLWCDSCKRRSIRKSKLMVKWSKPTK